MSTNRFTYIEPKDKFKKINMDVIMRYEPYIVGVYCKLATMSSGKSLSIDFLAKKLGVSKDRMRKAIVQLEKDGYIKRMPINDERGRMAGWNYYMFAEPLSEAQRSHAGVRVTDLPSYGISDNTENGQDTIIDNISNSNIDNCTINSPVKKKDIDTVPGGTVFTPEENAYFEKMKRRFPRIMKMSEPLTLEQAKKLKAKFDDKLLLKIMTDMDNWKPLTSKNVSAYKTIIKWCEKEIERI